jgi:tetratricopeptide (TPR) repeat protein
LIFGCLSVICSGQNNIFLRADSLTEVGNFDLANLEYERIRFQYPESPEAFTAGIKKGLNQKAAGKYKEATHTFQLLFVDTLSEVKKFEVLYHKAVCSYLAGNLQETHRSLEHLNYWVKDSLLLIPTLPLQALLYAHCEYYPESAEKYEAAKKYFSRDGGAFRVVSSERDLDLKNPEKARRLSLIFPGAGQVYAGYFWKGLSSLLIQTVWAGYAVLSYSQGLYFTGTLSGVSLFLRFWTGGARLAEKLANQKNNSKKQKYLNIFETELMSLKK